MKERDLSSSPAVCALRTIANYIIKKIRKFSYLKKKDISVLLQILRTSGIDTIFPISILNIYR